MPSFTIYADENDWQIVCTSNVWADARSGAGSRTAASSTALVLRVGAIFQSPLYGVYQSYLQFDTSGITDTFNSGSLNLRVSIPSSGDEIEAREHEWALSDVASFVPGDSLSSKALIGRVAMGTTAAVYITIPYGLSDIPRTSAYKIMLNPRKQADNSLPSTTTAQAFNSANLGGTTSDPYLAVDTSTGPGTQTLTFPSVFNNFIDQAVYEPIVTRGAVALAPTLYTNTQSFFSPTVSLGGNAQQLTPTLFTSAQSFYGPTVVKAAVTLSPARHDNVQTFYAPTVGRGAVTLISSLYSNGQAFFPASVAAGSRTLSPPLLTNAASFYGPSVSLTDVIAPLEFVNQNIFYAPSLSVGPVTLAADLFVNNQTFFSPKLRGWRTVPPLADTWLPRV